MSSITISGKEFDVNYLIRSRMVLTVTFGGAKIVKIGETGKSIYLNDLAQKLLRAGPSPVNADIEEAVPTMISNKLKDFYIVADDQVKHSNILTRILSYARDVFYRPDIKSKIEKTPQEAGYDKCNDPWDRSSPEYYRSGEAPLSGTGKPKQEALAFTVETWSIGQVSKAPRIFLVFCSNQTKNGMSTTRVRSWQNQAHTQKIVGSMLTAYLKQTKETDTDKIPPEYK